MNKQEKELAIQELEKAQEALAVQMAELKAARVEPEKYKRFRAKHGELYWYLTDEGLTQNDIDNLMVADDYRWRTGNYKETRPEAVQDSTKRLAKQRIIDRIAEENYKGGWEVDLGDCNQNKCYAYIDHRSGLFKVANGAISQHTDSKLCCWNKEVFKELEADYKIMWGIE